MTPRIAVRPSFQRFAFSCETLAAPKALPLDASASFFSHAFITFHHFVKTCILPRRELTFGGLLGHGDCLRTVLVKCEAKIIRLMAI